MVSGVEAAAPGKVLITGGYLVLDRMYSGLVLGVSAKVHVEVFRREGGEEGKASPTKLTVCAPQFSKVHF